MRMILVAAVIALSSCDDGTAGLAVAPASSVSVFADTTNGAIVRCYSVVFNGYVAGRTLSCVVMP